MSAEDQIRWDERYATGDYRPRATPSPFLEHALEVVPPGRALVLARGTGRNALYLAEAGFEVVGTDISKVAIAQARVEAERRGLEVTWRVADLDTVDLEPDAYALITMIRYVNRQLWPQIVTAVARNGWLLLEQHLRTSVEVRGPGDEFRLEPGELLGAFPGFRIIEYAEGLEPADDGPPAALTRLLACKGVPGW